jgi:hypothetical protein
MNFDKAFNKLSRLVQVILLLIPGVNWVTELLVRLSVYLRTKDLTDLVVAILAIIPPTGVIMGWVDLVWVLVYNHLFLTKK